VINLPEASQGDKMTAYETEQRVKEYIRRALPLFEPMETEYNGGLCEMTWNICMDLNAFGSFEDMPPILASRDIIWQFESPLQAANERVKAEAFQQSAQLLAMARRSIRPSRPTSTCPRRSAMRSRRGPGRLDRSGGTGRRGEASRGAEKAAMEAANAMATGADVATRMGTAVQSAGDAAQSLQAAGTPCTDARQRIQHAPPQRAEGDAEARWAAILDQASGVHGPRRVALDPA
jgi:hypothetical protein